MAQLYRMPAIRAMVQPEAAIEILAGKLARPVGTSTTRTHSATVVWVYQQVCKSTDPGWLSPEPAQRAKGSATRDDAASPPA